MKTDMFVYKKCMIFLISILLISCNYQSTSNDADIIISSQKSNIGGVELSAFTFNNSVPGPLLEANIGEKKSISFYNALDTDTSVHFHGIIPSNNNDGVPYVTQDLIKPGETYTYDLTFPHNGLFWYHSHVNGYEQVERGLQAPFLVREKNPVVPKENEIVYVIDDILIRGNDWYPFSTRYMHGRNGNMLLVNGERYEEDYVPSNAARLRIVNTANARNAIISFGGKDALVLGKDLEFGEPYNASTIFLPPAGRIDLIVYGDNESPTYVNRQIGNQIFPVSRIIYGGTPIIINFPAYENFSNLRSEFEKLPIKDTISMTGYMRPMHGIEWTFNGKTYPENPLTYKLNKGKHVFEIKNTQGQPHPIHFHGMKFMILERNGVTANDNFWYDTVYVGSSETVKIGLVIQDIGTWVFHCHILEHADSGMLGIIEVEE